MKLMAQAARPLTRRRLHVKTVQVLMSLLAAALAASPVAAKEHIVDIVWGADGAFRHAATVAPGKFVEVCGKFRAGEKVAWEFEAAEAVDFNIHYHAGKDTVFPAKLAQTLRARDTLAVTAAEDYCWMWTNKNPAPAQVSVSLKR